MTHCCPPRRSSDRVGASLLAPTQALLLQAEAIYSPIQFDCRTSTRTFTLVADEQSLELCFPALAWAFAAAAPLAHLLVPLLRHVRQVRFDSRSAERRVG